MSDEVLTRQSLRRALGTVLRVLRDKDMERSQVANEIREALDEKTKQSIELERENVALTARLDWHRESLPDGMTSTLERSLSEMKEGFMAALVEVEEKLVQAKAQWSAVYDKLLHRIRELEDERTLDKKTVARLESEVDARNFETQALLDCLQESADVHLSKTQRSRMHALQNKVNALNAQLSETKQSHVVDAVWIRVLEEELGQAQAELGDLLKKIKYVGTKVEQKDNLVSMYLAENERDLAEWQEQQVMEAT
ncbi:MAG: hypothetical protein KVP17_000692 [Porospora cf. gigantea B]|uniref:uncharacterized protein n=1 Tax=Porospora cf. gigantea B TaxID=2853592 RepID=UPI003571A372|nr:MAG: hypothetical protein KVP17_000692 [Porospora cf. gigantea B]